MQHRKQKKQSAYQKYFPIVWYSFGLILLVLAFFKLAYSGTPPSEPPRYDKIDGGIATDSTDVTTALKAAISRAQTTTGYVRLDSGVVLLKDSIVIPSGVEIVGNQTRVRFVDAAKGFVLRNNTTIKGFSIIETMWSDSAPPTGAEEFGSPISVGDRTTGSGYHDIEISNLTAKSNRNAGADIVITGNTYNVKVENVRCETNYDSTRFGVLIKYASDGNDSTYHPRNIDLNNIWVDSLDPPDTNGYAISLDGVYGAKVANITTEYSYMGIDIRPDSLGFTFAHSDCNLDQDGFSPAVLLINSHFNNVWTWGIRVSGSVEDAGSADTISLPLTVIGCTFTGQDTTAAAGYGSSVPTGAMHRYHAMGVTYINCSFFNWNRGISFDEADGVDIQNCLFERNQYDIYAHSSSYPDNITISENSFRNHSASGTSGIYIGRAGHVVIQNNRFGRPIDSSYRYPIHVINPSSTPARLKIVNNHVVNISAHDSARAYRLLYDPSILVFEGNSIDTQYVDTGDYSTTATYAGRWSMAKFLGGVAEDTSVGATDNYVWTYDATSGKARWEAAPGAGSGDDIVIDTGGVGGEVDVNNPTIGGGHMIGASVSGSAVNFFLYGDVPDSNIASASEWSEAYDSVTSWGDVSAVYFPYNGGTLSGNINMGSNDIIGVDSINATAITVARLRAPVSSINLYQNLAGSGGNATISAMESVQADTIKTHVTQGKIYNNSGAMNLQDNNVGPYTLTQLYGMGPSVSSAEITNGVILEEDLSATNSPTDNYLLSYDQSSGGFTWVVSPTGGGSGDTALCLSEAAGGADKVYWDNDTLEICTGGNDTLKFYNNGTNWVMSGGNGLPAYDSLAILSLFKFVSGSDTTSINKSLVDSMINQTGRFATGNVAADIGDTINARMTKAVTGNTETGIAVTYNSTDSTYDFVAEVTQAELDAIANDTANFLRAVDSVDALDETYFPIADTGAYSTTLKGDMSDTGDVVRSEIRDTIEAVVDTVCVNFSIVKPDAVNDTVALFYVSPAMYPSGITITRLDLYTGNSTGTYALQFEEWETSGLTARTGYIDTLTIANDSAHVHSTTFMDANIAANGSIWVIVPATDVDWIGGAITFTKD